MWRRTAKGYRTFVLATVRLDGHGTNQPKSQCREIYSRGLFVRGFCCFVEIAYRNTDGLGNVAPKGPAYFTRNLKGGLSAAKEIRAGGVACLRCP
jgi:hypothetical protein